jgi:hypothetical protein
VAHTVIYRSPGSTSLVLAPTQKQSAEFVRRLREHVLKAGQPLRVDTTFGIELENGSRCLAMPGQDDASIRGLTISGGDLVIDEAARVDDRLYDAARPMLIRFARTARLILQSTAWAKDGFFHRVWSEGDPRDWIKIEQLAPRVTPVSSGKLKQFQQASNDSERPQPGQPKPGSDDKPTCHILEMFQWSYSPSARRGQANHAVPDDHHGR